MLSMIQQIDIDDIKKLFEENENITVILKSYYPTVKPLSIEKNHREVIFRRGEEPPWTIDISFLSINLHRESADYHSWIRKDKQYGCGHHWVDVGFRFEKWVCKHCDINKE